MSVYARSDICAVSISAAHGGCGHGHARPVENGAPAKTWILDCPQCSDYLRHDSLWSVTAAEIPETHDEKNARTDFERRGAKDKDAVLTLALARLAGFSASDLPESLTRMISGIPAHVAAEMECPNGHGQPPGRKFCGQPMRGNVAKAALSSPRKPAQAPPSPEPPGRPRRLRDARLDELQDLARGRGVDDSGTRGDLIARLSAAGVTSAALQAA